MVMKFDALFDLFKFRKSNDVFSLDALALEYSLSLIKFELHCAAVP